MILNKLSKDMNDYEIVEFCESLQDNNETAYLPAEQLEELNFISDSIQYSDMLPNGRGYVVKNYIQKIKPLDVPLQTNAFFMKTYGSMINPLAKVQINIGIS